MQSITQPQKSTVPSYYHRYLDLIEGQPVLRLLHQNAYAVPAFFYGIPDDKWHYSYAEGKWTIAQVALHLIDVEQIFCYRALRIARGDQSSMAGFDQNAYAEASCAERRSKRDVIDEYYMTRRATLTLLDGLEEDVADYKGFIDENEVSFTGLIHIIAGHEAHHMNVLMDRYL